MLIGLRIAMADAKPYDARISWIGTDTYPNGSYIDCGFFADGTTSVECDMQFTSFNYRDCVGQFDTDMRFVFGKGGPSWTDWFFGFGTSYIRVGSQDTLRHVFAIDGVNKKARVDSTQYDLTGTFTKTGYSVGFSLFNRMSPITGTTAGTECSGCERVYGLAAWKSGAKIRDLIPVRVGSVGYMYDKVSGKLFGNAGTGSFTLGPDITEEWQ